VGISRSTGGGNYQGQVVGISRSIGGGNYQGQVVGEIIKVKWWGYQGQLVGEIIKVKWWGYLGQVVGISRPSGGDIKVRGRGLEVKVKKKWWGVRALSNSLYCRGFKDLFPIPVSCHHALEEWKACVCRRGLLFKLIFCDRNPSEIASILGRVPNQKSIVTWVTTFRP
jgi:hypothetical protein